MTEGDGNILVYVDPDLEDLIPGFLDDLQEDFREILDAIEKGDFETVQRLGHRMKGAGGSYGLDIITEIGRTIEEAAKSKDVEEIRKLLDKSFSCLERMEIIYN